MSETVVMNLVTKVKVTNHVAKVEVAYQPNSGQFVKTTSRKDVEWTHVHFSTTSFAGRSYGTAMALKAVPSLMTSVIISIHTSAKIRGIGDIVQISETVLTDTFHVLLNHPVAYVESDSLKVQTRQRRTVTRSEDNRPKIWTAMSNVIQITLDRTPL